MSGQDLSPLRDRIDALDDEVLRLLNERATLAAEVARLKERLSLPFYAPSRERAVLDRLVARNPGPFPAEAVRAVFREVMSACLSLEEGLRVAYLGPEGGFTHAAVKLQFGLSARAWPVGTIAAVFEEVARARADFGVLPLESAAEGVVSHALDAFLEPESSDLRISAEIELEVANALCVRPGLGLASVERVYAPPAALATCRRALHAHVPRAALVEAASTSEALRLAREDAQGAAVAPELAARLVELSVATSPLDDAAEAARFLVIGRAHAEPTGRDRTSVLLSLRDVPGVLHRALAPLAANGVDLRRIESRPSGLTKGELVFFLDVEGHERDAAVARALAAMRPLCEAVRVLGSYPHADPAA